MTYDTARLAELGAKWQRLEVRRERLRSLVHVEILAALAGGVPIARVRELTGYQGDAVRQILYRNRMLAVGDLPLRAVLDGLGLDTPGARARAGTRRKQPLT